MKKWTLLAFLALPLTGLMAQSGDSEPLRLLVDRLFEAMWKADTAAVRSLFTPDAFLETVQADDSGNARVRRESLENFIAAVAQIEDFGYEERIWTWDIRMDGPLAQAWLDYTFFVDGEFSHCGVDMFVFHRMEGAWKIAQLTDTRRREGCRLKLDETAKALHAELDAWHQAAAEADEDTFFGFMAPKGMYLGTDATERWTRDELAVWAKPYFERESAWAFTMTQRHMYYDEDGQTVWFDELLNTRMGVCRGSGVLRLYPDGWKLEQYNLAIAVPNEKVDKYLKLLKRK